MSAGSGLAWSVTFYMALGPVPVGSALGDACYLDYSLRGEHFARHDSNGQWDDA